MSDETQAFTPINTGLAEKVRQKAEAEKARLRAVMPSTAATIVEAGEVKIKKLQTLNEVPNESVINPGIPGQKNTGLAQRNAQRIEEEKKRLKALMPSAAIVEEAPPVTEPTPVVVGEQVDNTPDVPTNSPDPLRYYEDVEKEFGKLIDFDIENKKAIKETTVNEGKQKNIKSTELNTMLYAVQKELRENESPELEKFANSLSEEIVQTIISGAKTYNYDKYCGLVKTFTKLTEG